MYGTGNDLQNYPCLCLVITNTNTIPNNLKELSPVLMTVAPRPRATRLRLSSISICLPVVKETFSRR